MSAFSRTLPERPSLEQQQKLAKELLDAFHRGDHDAHDRIRAQLPDKAKISLADCQFVLAREYGFESWAALKAHIDSVAGRVPAKDRFRALVNEGDPAKLHAALKADASLRALVNAPIFSFDAPALASVAGRNDVKLVDILLEFGADPNRKSSWWAGGFHPLYSARGEVADRLLAAGAIPDACAAAALDRPDLLRDILRADPARVHERGGDGQTPLHFARSREVADILVDASADLDARDVDHRSTPAEWMVQDRSELAEYLVDRGATADVFLAAALGLTDRMRSMLERDPDLLGLRTSQGEYGEKPPSSYHIYQWAIGPGLTPLQVAAKFGRRETLAAMTPFASPIQLLLLACHEGRADDARAIVRANPGIVEALEGADRRALTDEAWTANGPAVALMMELGFDPTAPAVTGPTGGNALHCAAWEGSVECIEAILRYPRGRALIDSREPVYNGTPLSWCAHGSENCGRPSADHVGVARRLIEAGATITPEMRGWAIVRAANPTSSSGSP
jgi:ankyrin repeat protein